MATRGKKKPGKNRRRKKKQDLTLKLGIGMAVVIVLLAGGLTAIFSVNSRKYQDHFLPGTVINGVECEDLTVEEAEATISSQASSYQLTVIPKTGQPGVIKGSDIGYAYTSDGSVKRLMEEQDSSAWFGNREKKELSVTGITYDPVRLRAVSYTHLRAHET